jgi:signal peptidase I
MNSLAWFAILLGVIFAINTLTLRLGARLFHLPKRSLWRCFLATLILVFIRLAAAAISYGTDFQINSAALALYFALIFLMFGLALDWLVIALILGGRLSRVVGTWFVSIVMNVGSILILAFVIVKPYVIDVYFAPTHSMEPTIRSWRVERVLDDGDVLIIPALEPGKKRPFWGAGKVMAIHAKDFTTEELDAAETPNHIPDRFTCNKLKQPNRWDIICHSVVLNDVEVKYVKRLVGLPGEEIFIDDGDVWINGERMQRPDSIRALKYLAADDDRHGVAEQIWATRKKPLKLGPDECFLLGDNTNASSDSRYFGPVRRSTIEGVVDLIYWPPSRWQILP